MEEVNQTIVADHCWINRESSALDDPITHLPRTLFGYSCGKSGMIILILFNCQLHTPMYYLLSHLSLIDCCESTVITPKMLINFVTGKNVISYPEYMDQYYFFCVFAIAQCHMLAAMAGWKIIHLLKGLLYKHQDPSWISKVSFQN